MINISKETVITLAKRYGDAFYLLDSKQYQKNYEKLFKAFSSIYPNFNIGYSYKTNYTPKLCQTVNELGSYAEVVSEMELELALHCGVHPDKIIWNGPVKNIEKVITLLLEGGLVNVDNLVELNDIQRELLQYSHKKVRLGIRCNFDVGDGVTSRFGFDVESSEFEEAIQLFQNNHNLFLASVQCHFAKRDIKYWSARVEGLIARVHQIADKIGYLPDIIDFGGGMYGNMSDDLQKQFDTHIPSYSDYANIVATKMLEQFPNHKPQLVVEPGSALVGDCMQFVGKVTSIKKVRDKYFATVMGSQKNINMTGVNPPLTIIEAGDNRTYYQNLDIVGYTCIENDVLFKNYDGFLAKDDFLVFGNCGSYSLVMKPPFILPNFPVLDISHEKVELIKQEETFEDIFHTFIF